MIESCGDMHAEDDPRGVVVNKSRIMFFRHRCPITLEAIASGAVRCTRLATTVNRFN